MNYEKIKDLCYEIKITIPQLSKKIGMSNSFYTTMKSGSLKVETLEKISEVLGVHISVFFDKPSSTKIEQLEERLAAIEEKLNQR